MSQASIPENFLDLFNKRAFAHLATVMPDGSPQVTPVWVDYDGKDILVNTARGRQKDRNMKRDARVAIEIMDPDNPYRFLQVRGHITEIVEEGADDHIDKMAQKYLGQERYPFRSPGEVRVLFRIQPDRVNTSG